MQEQAEEGVMQVEAEMEVTEIRRWVEWEEKNFLGNVEGAAVAVAAVVADMVEMERVERDIPCEREKDDVQVQQLQRDQK